MNFFDHKDLGNHLLLLCPEVVKQPVYMYLGLLDGLHPPGFIKTLHFSSPP